MISNNAWLFRNKHRTTQQLLPNTYKSFIGRCKCCSEVLTTTTICVKPSPVLRSTTVLSEQGKPSLCPLCGSTVITQMLCDIQLLAQFRGTARPSEGVAAFQCEGSHVFLVLHDDFKWGERTSNRANTHGKSENRGVPGKSVRERIERKASNLALCIGPLVGALVGRKQKFQSLNLDR
jgi:hypothetical protein